MLVQHSIHVLLSWNMLFLSFDIGLVLILTVYLFFLYQTISSLPTLHLMPMVTSKSLTLDFQEYYLQAPLTTQSLQDPIKMKHTISPVTLVPWDIWLQKWHYLSLTMQRQMFIALLWSLTLSWHWESRMMVTQWPKWKMKYSSRLNDLLFCFLPWPCPETFESSLRLDGHNSMQQGLQ